MKNIIKSLLPLAFAALAGCTVAEHGDTGVPAYEGGISFSSGRTGVNTKVDASQNDKGAISVFWQEGDEVGIFGRTDGLSAGDNWKYYSYPDKDTPASCDFTAGSSKEVFRWNGEARQSFYSYYPWSGEGNTMPESVAFAMASSFVQSGDEPLKHIAGAGMWVARPVVIEADAEEEPMIDFSFRNVLSVLELRLKLKAGSTIDAIPVDQVRIVSDNVPLAGKGTVDITVPDTDAGFLSLTESSQEVAVSFDNVLNVVEEDYVSVFIPVVPGSHAASALSIELRAIDYSVNTYVFSEEVSFAPNMHYVREMELDMDGFIAANPYEAELPELTSLKVGEDFTVGFRGDVKTIEFWSGEWGNDYAFKSEDRIDQPEWFTFNFKMALENGFHRSPMKVKYSSDFAGDYTKGYTEADITAASWTDMSGSFNWTTRLYNQLNKEPDGTVVKAAKLASTTVPHDVGVGKFPWTDGMYVSFFYHIDKYDADYVDPETGGTGNGRTYFYLYDYTLNAVYHDGSEEEFCTLKWEMDASATDLKPVIKKESGAPVFIQSDTFGADDSRNILKGYPTYNGGKSPYTMRFGATFNKATEDRNSWLVLPQLKTDGKNFGPDSPQTVKGNDEACPASYTWKFTSPGTYKVYVVASVPTLDGGKEVIDEITVTVTE